MEKQMKAALIAAILFFANSGLALAQSGNGRPTTPQQTAEAQNLYEQYNAKYRNKGADARQVLDGVYANGLAKTAENVKSIRASLASNVTKDEKVALVRILGSLYTYDDRTKMNNAIAQDLRGMAHSDDKDIARAATLSFSRLGYFQDSPDVLLNARNKSFIEVNEYYGELAHMVRNAPVNDQLNLVSKIKSGKSRYAAEILAFVAQDKEASKKIYPETKKLIQSCLEENEPGFAQATGEFSLTNAIQYATWLHAVATLKSDTSNVKYGDIVFSFLNDEKTEPRKIMAFLSSSEGKSFIQGIGQKGQFGNALQRISLYSKQYPQNFIMKDLVQDITGTINSLKG
jgi:hypothetical protein